MFVRFLEEFEDTKNHVEINRPLETPRRFKNRTSKFDFIRVMALLWKIRVDPGGGHFIASFFRLLVFYLTVRASRHFFFCFVCKKITKHTKRNDRSWLFFCGHAWNITFFYVWHVPLFLYVAELFKIIPLNLMSV